MSGAGAVSGAAWGATGGRDPGQGRLSGAFGGAIQGGLTGALGYGAARYGAAAYRGANAAGRGMALGAHMGQAARMGGKHAYKTAMTDAVRSYRYIANGINNNKTLGRIASTLKTSRGA